MMRAFRWAVYAALLAAASLAIAASSAAAAEEPYEFEPKLSLTGNCSTLAPDTVPDPGCPGGLHPPGGRFSRPTAIAIDSYGNEYVASWGENGNGRIDIFDDEGNFISELPDPHGPQGLAVDTKGNLYAFEHTPSTSSEIALYEPSVYQPEAGNIDYENSRKVIDSSSLTGIGGVAIDVSTDHLYVVWNGESEIGQSQEGVYEYGTAEEGNPLLHFISNPKIHAAVYVAVDAQRRRIYVSSCRNEIEDCVVLPFEADPPYNFLNEEIDGSNTPAGAFISIGGKNSIAVDESSGHFFIEDLSASHRIFEFDENYEYVSTTTYPFLEGTFFKQMAISNSVHNEGANNYRYLFVPLPVTEGRAFAFNPPNEGPPGVQDLTAGGIGEREAELRATVNPHGGDTHYIFEYVTEEEFEEDGYAAARIAGEGTVSGKSQPTQVFGRAAGLSPGTSYLFRVRATNGKGEVEAEASFTTYSDAPATAVCPNEALRVGLSAALPDCRAYELVTPPDTNGHAVKGLLYAGDLFSTVFSSPEGNAVTFSTEGGALPGLGGTGSAFGDRYRATRGSGGWNIVSTGPNGTEAVVAENGSTSLDQGFGFWWDQREGSALVNNEPTSYIMYPDGHSELIGRGELRTDPKALGKFISQNGTHIVFQTKNDPKGTPAKQLELDAPPEGTETVYDRTLDEVTHVVSLLPGNSRPKENENAHYVGASNDGEGIVFEIGTKLYLRVHDEATYEVGENVTFAGVADGGRRVFYVKGGNLFALDTETAKRIPFTATGNATVVNAAPGGTRAYFTSPTAVSGAEANPNGELPKKGKENLYLSEEGVIRFIGSVTSRDVEGEFESTTSEMVDGLGLWTRSLALGWLPRDPSRVNPDGSVLLFQSRANLSGYDPEGAAEIYRYDSGDNRLQCISCIPTKAAAEGGASLESYGPLLNTREPFSAYGFVQNLTPDGRRVFFQSKEALVPTDNDRLQDVYEWEEDGVGSCNRPGGCVYLISSGRSAHPDYLYAMSRSGDDVFMTTEDVLVNGDNDTLSIYDARVNGGFAEAPEDECTGEGCRPTVTPAPNLATPAAPARGAHDNVEHRRCPKGKRAVKRKGKVRCVKKHHKHRRHKANKSGRTTK